jgi:hypothetical protein
VSINLENYQLLTIFVISSLVILGASEIGRLVGARALGQGGGDVVSQQPMLDLAASIRAYDD